MKRVLVVGNRLSALIPLLNSSFTITKVLPVSDSRLHEFLKINEINYAPIRTFVNMMDEINKIEFDILISAGCPYILPKELIFKDN